MVPIILETIGTWTIDFLHRNIFFCQVSSPNRSSLCYILPSCDLQINFLNIVPVNSKELSLLFLNNWHYLKKKKKKATEIARALKSKIQISISIFYGFILNLQIDKTVDFQYRRLLLLNYISDVFQSYFITL